MSKEDSVYDIEMKSPSDAPRDPFYQEHWTSVLDHGETVSTDYANRMLANFRKCYPSYEFRAVKVMK